MNALTDNPAYILLFSGRTTPDVSDSIECPFGPACRRSVINTDGTFRKAPAIGTMCVILRFVREIPIEAGHPRIISIPTPEKAHVTASSFFTAVRPSGGVHAAASARAVGRS
jgi:hypothetical protein